MPDPSDQLITILVEISCGTLQWSAVDMPRVLVSDFHDTLITKNWVLELAARLRRNGVNIIVDQFEARLGSDLPRFTVGKQFYYESLQDLHDQSNLPLAIFW
jgi:hypothetical protein